MNFPITIVDNFFEDADKVRNYALSLDYNYPKGYYPGFRTEQLLRVNRNFYEYLKSKILMCFFNPYKDMLDVELECQFQYIPSYFEHGWIHQDIDFNRRNLAGVIYLSPDPPENTGTGFYKKINDPDYQIINHRNNFYKNNFVTNAEEYRNHRENHNQNFKTIQDVYNLYNRAAIYDTNIFHKENGFFGSSKEDSRLTLVFFMTLSPIQQTQFPIQRMNNIIFTGDL